MSQKTYCVCQKPAGYNRFMILCEKCDVWFHGSCVGITKTTKLPEKWFCPPCRGKDRQILTEKIEGMEAIGTVFQEFKKSTTLDIMSAKQDIASVSSEVQSLKSEVSNLKIVVQALGFQKKQQDLKDQKDKELNDAYDVKAKCLEKEYQEKLNKVERAFEKEICEMKKKHELQINEMSEMYELKCKELMEMKRQLEKLEKERNKTKDSTSLTRPGRKSLSLKRTSASQPTLDMDRYDERDAGDFRAPPK